MDLLLWLTGLWLAVVLTVAATVTWLLLLLLLILLQPRFKRTFFCWCFWCFSYGYVSVAKARRIECSNMEWGPGPYPLTRSRLLCCCSGSGALGFIRFVVGYVTTVILPHQIDRNGVKIPKVDPGPRHYLLCRLLWWYCCSATVKLGLTSFDVLLLLLTVSWLCSRVVGPVHGVQLPGGGPRPGLLCRVWWPRWYRGC